MSVLTTSQFIERYKPCEPIRAYMTLSESLKEAWEWCVFPEWMLMGLREVGFNTRWSLLLTMFGMVETLIPQMDIEDKFRVEQVSTFLTYGEMVNNPAMMENMTALNRFSVRLHRVMNTPQMVGRAVFDLIYLCGVPTITKPNYLLMMEICSDVTSALCDDKEHATARLAVKVRLSHIIRRNIHWDEVAPFVTYE